MNIVTRIDWRETLLSMKIDEQSEMKNLTLKDLNASKQMATRLKREGVALFRVSAEKGLVIKRLPLETLESANK